MASFTTVFLLMRSSTPMNRTLAVVISYVLSTILTSASGTPIHRSIAITFSLGTVSKAFSMSTNSGAIPPCISSLFFTICLRTYIPSALPLPFLNPCCSSPNSPSTLLLILASKTLSNSFSTWLSSVMPLYFPASCPSPFLFHICTVSPILHSFDILPSCIHTFSSLPVHLTPTSTAFSNMCSRTSSAPVALPFSSCTLLFPLLPVLSPPLPPLSQPSSGAQVTCCFFSVQQLIEVCRPILNTS